MLETLGEPDIKKMSLEEPEREPNGFDVRDHLTEADLLAIRGDLVVKLAENPDEFFEMAVSAKKLDLPVKLPYVSAQQKKKFFVDAAGTWLSYSSRLWEIKASIDPDLEIPIEEREAVEDKLDRCSADGNWGDFLAIALNMKRLGFSYTITGEKIELLKHILETLHGNGEMNSYDSCLRKMRLLGIDVETSSDSRARLSQISSSCRHETAWFSFASHVRKMKEMGISVDLTPEDIQGMESDLESLKGDWDRYLEMAEYMQFILQPVINNSLSVGTTPSIPLEREF